MRSGKALQLTAQASAALARPHRNPAGFYDVGHDEWATRISQRTSIARPAGGVAAGDDVGCASVSRSAGHHRVARWWDGWPDPEDALAKPDHQIWAIMATGEVAGLIKWYERCASIVRFASIDMFIHQDYHRRGYASDALRTLIKWLFTNAGHHRITIDPARDNTAAIRCAEHVGFQQVGVLRQYERTPQGGFRDGLLMDLLASDFVA